MRDEADKTTLDWLASEIGPLNERCAQGNSWDYSEQKNYRDLRRISQEAAQRYLNEQCELSAEQEDARKNLANDVDNYLDVLCSYYLGANDEKREFIRALVGGHKHILGNLMGYVARKTQQLKLNGGSKPLSLGLAAVAINDGRYPLDYDDVVGMLYAAAVAAGLDPTPYFRTAADMANSEGSPSTRDFLLNYEPSDLCSGSAYWGKFQAAAFKAERAQKEAASAYRLEDMIGGAARQSSIELFLKLCNKRDTLFITDVWIGPRLEQLSRLLSDPITEKQAAALKDVILKRSKIDDLIGWLKDQEKPWTFFDQQRKQMAMEEERLKKEIEKREYEKRYEESERSWRAKGRTPEEAARNDRDLQSRYSQEEAKNKYLSKARSCPKCGLAPGKLEWFYYVTPLPPYEQKWVLHGFGGWMTFCENCDITVDFFDEVRVYF